MASHFRLERLMVVLEAVMSRHESRQQSETTSSVSTAQTPGAAGKTLANRQQSAPALNGEENYRSLFEKNPLPAWVFDRETLAFLAVNDAAASRYGHSRSEMLGQTIKDVYASEDVQRLLAAGTGESKPAAWTTRRKDGTVVSIEVNGQEVDFAGRPARLVVVRDVSLRNQAAEALQEAGQRKNDFLEVLAHELRNPLAPIRNALQVLKQPGVGSPTAERLRQMMERQVTHLSRLVEDLVIVSRLNQGRIVLRKEVVAAAVVLGRAAEAMQSRFEERRQVLSVRAAADLRLEADLTRLEQVLLNLLHNAAKYTDPGGQVWLTAEREGNEAVIRVKDVGIGITPAMLPIIFDPLVQLERRLDHSRGGVGVGLTIVRKLVELHGGTVGAYSAALAMGGIRRFVCPACRQSRRSDGSSRQLPQCSIDPRQATCFAEHGQRLIAPKPTSLPVTATRSI